MTSPRRLTTARIDAAHSTGRDVWLSDNDGTRGHGRLTVRVSPADTKLFYFRYQLNGRTKTLPMGRYSRVKLEGFLTLEQAREQARHYSVLLRDPATRDLKQGLAPVPAPVPSSSAAPPNASGTPGIDGTTVLDLCNAYVAELEHRGSHRSALDARTDTRNYVANTRWAGVGANALTTADVAELMRGVAARCSAHKANRIRSVLSAAYSLAQGSRDDANVSVDLTRFAITSNPVASAKKMKRRRLEGAPSTQLDRNLSAAELGHFWGVLTSPPQAESLQFRVIKLSILLGGQRGEQLLRALASNIDLEERTLMIFDGKGNRPEARKHILPLTELALREIEPLVHECERTGEPFLFSGKRRGSHLSHSFISRTVAGISDDLIRTGKIKKSFRYRDIRKTAESRMSDLNIAKEVRAQLQSHDMGGVQTKHYNFSDFLPQKRKALEQWESYLLQCAAACEAERPTTGERPVRVERPPIERSRGLIAAPGVSAARSAKVSSMT